jgi:hypothetical protein
MDKKFDWKFRNFDGKFCILCGKFRISDDKSSFLVGNSAFWLEISQNFYPSSSFPLDVFSEHPTFPSEPVY